MKENLAKCKVYQGYMQDFPAKMSIVCFGVVHHNSDSIRFLKTDQRLAVIGADLLTGSGKNNAVINFGCADIQIDQTLLFR